MENCPRSAAAAACSSCKRLEFVENTSSLIFKDSFDTGTSRFDAIVVETIVGSARCCGDDLDVSVDTSVVEVDDANAKSIPELVAVVITGIGGGSCWLSIDGVGILRMEGDEGLSISEATLKVLEILQLSSPAPIIVVTAVLNFFNELLNIFRATNSELDGTADRGVSVADFLEIDTLVDGGFPAIILGPDITITGILSGGVQNPVGGPIIVWGEWCCWESTEVGFSDDDEWLIFLLVFNLKIQPL